MTDLALAEPDALPSTVIDTEAAPGPSGAGTPRTLEPVVKEPAKAPSLREVVSDAVKKDADDKDDAPDEGKAEKAAEKPEKDAKPADAKEAGKGAERAPDGKFAAKQAEDAKPAEGVKPEEKPTEAKTHIEPPSKFLPDAKETWRNTPRPVQRDVDNLVREHETELTRHREAAERYEPIRRYDEVARQHGRAGVHESLEEVAQLEDMMGKNPLAALNQILMRAGPRKADGQPMSLFEVAQFIVDSGQDGYQKMVAPPRANGHAQPDPEVQQLKEQLARFQEQQLTSTVIEPFKRDHPRYDELQQDIALFLQIGKIPTSLSPPDRLAAAYDMAVRINPASRDDSPASDADLEPARRADDDLSGSKSIKSAPGAVSPDMEPERGGSISDLLRDELKRAKRS